MSLLDEESHTHEQGFRQDTDSSIEGGPFYNSVLETHTTRSFACASFSLISADSLVLPALRRIGRRKIPRYEQPTYSNPSHHDLSLAPDPKHGNTNHEPCNSGRNGRNVKNPAATYDVIVSSQQKCHNTSAQPTSTSVPSCFFLVLSDLVFSNSGLRGRSFFRSFTHHQELILTGNENILQGRNCLKYY